MAFSDHVKVMFGADTSGVTDELKNTEKKVSKFKDKVSTMLAGALGTVAFTKATKAVIEYGTKVGDMADRLGTTTKFIQELTYASEQNGIKADSAKIAFQRFTRRLEEANTKGGPLKDTLDDIGVATTNLDGTTRDTEAVFKDFALTLTRMDNPAKKVRTAFQFLDTEGVALTQMFQDGKPTIEEYGEEAQKLGLILEDKVIREIQNADAELKKLKTGFITALAQGLTPFLTALTPIVQALNKLIVASANWAKEIVTITTTIGVLKLAITAGNWLGILAPAFRKIAIATGLANTAFGKLNKTMKANVFVLLTTAIVAGGTALFEWANKAKDATEKSKKLEDELKQKLKVAIADLKVLLGQATVETDKLAEEFDKLKKKAKITLDFDDAIDQLKEMNTELQGTITKLTNQVLKKQEGLQVLQNQRNELVAIGGKEKEILEIDKDIYTQKIAIEKLEKQILQESIKQKTASNEILELEKKKKDEYYAQELGLKDVLGEMDKQELALKRQEELTKTLKEENKEAYDKLVERHKMEDQVADLVKNQGMSVRDAWNSVLNINRNKRIQKGLLNEIKKKEGEAKAEAEKRLAENEKITAELQKQALAHAQARQEADLILQALQARVAGNNDLADKLEAQKDLQDAIKLAMDQQGLALGQAQAQVKARLDLEKEIELKKLDQEIAEKQLNGVIEQARKTQADLLDAEDRKRARIARTILHAEDMIMQAKKSQDAQAEATVKKWESVKYRNLALFLDDETQEDLDNLAKQKVIIQDNHAVQLAALKDAGQVVQDQALANQQAVAQAGIDIAQQGQAQQAKVQGVMDAGKDAIEDVGDATVKKLEAIKKDPAVKDAVADAETGIVQAIKDCCTKIVNAIKGIKLGSGSGAGGTPPAPATPPAPSAPINNVINVTISLDALKDAIKQLGQTLSSAIASLKGGGSGTPPAPPTPPPAPAPAVNNTINVTIDLTKLEQKLDQLVQQVVQALGQLGGGQTPTPPASPSSGASAPVVNVTVNMVSELKEETQIQIRDAVRGKFKYQ
jgi:hypothetical protein